MTMIRLGKKLITLRRDANITQEGLAAYMGVSKSSVSKWETETTLPDILLLPQLVTLSNVSVDKLIGYEPQLGMEAANKLYPQLGVGWSRDSANAYAHSEGLICEYYSCFSSLLQMAGLYPNHHMLHGKLELAMKRSEELCGRVIAKGKENSLVEDAISLEITYLITDGQPQKTLQLLGEEAKSIAQDGETIATYYQMLGKPKQSSRIFQTCICQHLLFVTQGMTNYAMMNTEDERLCDETTHRMLELLKLFHIDILHTIIFTMACMSCVIVYAQRRDKESVPRILERLIDVIIRYDLAHMKIHRDTYSTEVEAWMESLQLHTQVPRDGGTILGSLIQELQPPAFGSPKRESRYQACLQKLKAEKEKA